MLTEFDYVVKDAKNTGTIMFGGEYMFLKTDTYQEALDKLSYTAGEIGGVASGNGYRINVYPAFEDGYWSFSWDNKEAGVSVITYWTPRIARLEKSS